MTEFIVDAFEVIQIQGQQRQGQAMSHGTCAFPLGRVKEVTSGDRARQVVGSVQGAQCQLSRLARCDVHFGPHDALRLAAGDALQQLATRSNPDPVPVFVTHTVLTLVQGRLLVNVGALRRFPGTRVFSMYTVVPPLECQDHFPRVIAQQSAAVGAGG